ncbi:MAG: hypothetical protein KatS3mg096_463 [Candidatus Parcubacteria bacterium]|nr:MAG: hypothetical protein KatS3mg096_463 [Candidatus Parcubacteria bacterium]
MVEKVTEKEAARGVINKLVRFRGEVANALVPFLFLSLAQKPADSRNFNEEVMKALKPPTEIELTIAQSQKELVELIASTSYVQQTKEIAQFQIDVRELTEKFNNIEMIGKFLVPEKPIGISWFYALTINVPSRHNFEQFVRNKVQDLFIETAKTKWIPDVDALRRLEGKKYEISKVFVKVETEERRNIMIEFLRDIILREAEKRGSRRDIIYEILDRLSLRLNAFATVEIEIKDLETHESLILRGFGVPHKVGPTIMSIDRDLAILEAITDAFDNLKNLLKKAIGQRVYQSNVFMVVPNFK